MNDVSDELKSATKEAAKYIEKKRVVQQEPRWFSEDYPLLPRYIKIIIKTILVTIGVLFISFLYILYS